MSDAPLGSINKQGDILIGRGEKMILFFFYRVR
jgi:hypothetical protein